MWQIEVHVGWDWETMPTRYHNQQSALAEALRLTKKYGVGYRLLNTETQKTFTVNG